MRGTRVRRRRFPRIEIGERLVVIRASRGRLSTLERNERLPSVHTIPNLHLNSEHACLRSCADSNSAILVHHELARNFSCAADQAARCRSPPYRTMLDRVTRQCELAMHRGVSSAG